MRPARLPSAMLVAATPLAAVALLGACASVPSDRDAIDARAGAATTAAEHRQVASQYQALAEREASSAANYYSFAAQDGRLAAIGSAGRATPGHASVTLWAWQMRAGSDARAAAEARELAKLHRNMADEPVASSNAATR